MTILANDMLTSSAKILPDLSATLSVARIGKRGRFRSSKQRRTLWQNDGRPIAVVKSPSQVTLAILFGTAFESCRFSN